MDQKERTLGHIETLDLNFMGIQGAIASYLIPHAHGGVLVESGPGSTQAALTSALAEYGLTPGDISAVFLTHIHLDHAGAAGWLARQGAQVYVHPNGARHMIDPEKLIASASRIYGEMMDTLWGQFLPVPPEKLTVLEDNQVVEVEGLVLRCLDTPGHADHHYAYIYGDTCFTGDIGGVRLQGPPHLRLPMPPPEFHLEKWRQSQDLLCREYSRGSFRRLAPTHFGLYDDVGWHLDTLRRSLDEIEQWMEAFLPADPPVDEINARFLEWTRERSLNQGIPETLVPGYEAANPSWMSGYGMQRYWKKHRAAL
jgi:glyoxylase-like metal-dependent hydrolase (beta-lactamase superfamily II)